MKKDLFYKIIFTNIILKYSNILLNISTKIYL